MHIDAVHELFQLQARANGRSKHTRNQYARHVRMLLRWLADSGRSAEIEKVDHVAVAEFLCSPAVVEKRGGGPRRATSANGIRSSLRSFFAWAHAAGYAPRNAAALVRRARCRSAIGRVLTEDEVRRLEAALAGGRGPEAERDRVMVGLMLGSGLRVGSLVGIRAEDVGKGELRVRNAKGDVPTVVFVPRRLQGDLDRLASGQERGFLFVGRGGRGLTTRQVARRLGFWCQRAGLEPCSPHALRRTFGTSLYAATGDPLLVKRGLCHRSLASTLAYVAGVEEGLRKAVGA